MKNNSSSTRNIFDIIDLDSTDDNTYDFIDDKWIAFDLPDPDALRLSGPKRNYKEKRND